MGLAIRELRALPPPLTSNAKSGLKAISAIENGAKDYDTPEAKIRAVTADCFPFSGGSNAYPKISNKEIDKRMRDAADLGMNALGKMRGYTDSEWLDEMLGTDDGREWFLFEDQTFGCGMVADLINQGYTAKQVSQLIDIVTDVYSNSDLDSSPIEDSRDRLGPLSVCASFEILVGNYDSALKRFAQYCETEKNLERRNKG